MKFHSLCNFAIRFVFIFLFDSLTKSEFQRIARGPEKKPVSLRFINLNKKMSF